MSDISTKSGVFETGEKDEYGVAYKDGRIVGCYNKQLTEYIVKEGTEVICDRAFMNAKDLKSITLPATVKAIGESAFAGCKALEDINIPEGVTEIRQSTFRDCKSLGCLELPASCVKLEKMAFNDGLETLVCNAPSMQIDKSAFFSCKTLKTVMVPEGSAVIYAQVLMECRLTPEIEEMPEGDKDDASATAQVDKNSELEQLRQFINQIDSNVKEKLEEAFYNVIPQDTVIYSLDEDQCDGDDQMVVYPIWFTGYDFKNDRFVWFQGTKFVFRDRRLYAIQLIDEDSDELDDDCNWTSSKYIAFIEFYPYNYDAISQLLYCYERGWYCSLNEAEDIKLKRYAD